MNFLKKMSTNNLIIIGNTLEYYDLYLYIHLAHIINKQFFPHIAPDNQTLKLFSLMSMYFVAPLASILWGLYGDLIGRKRVLILGSVLMSISTSVIILIPSYVWWPEDFQSIPMILLFTIRVFQGIAMAGEPLAAKLYTLEHINNNKLFAMNKSASWIEKENIRKCIPLAVTKMTLTQTGGGILALGAGYLSIHCFSWEQAWRIPFIVAFLSTLFISYLRFYALETSDYVKATLNKNFSIFNISTMGEHFKSLKFSKQAFIACIILSFSYPSVFVFNFTFLSPIIIKKLGYSQDFLITYNLFICLLEFFLMYPLVSIPIKFKWDKKTTMAIYHLISAFCIYAFYNGILDKELHVCKYIAIQAFMLSFVSWNLIYGSVLKNLPILQRFTQMSISFAIGRLISFLLAIVFIPYFCSNGNIQNYCLILLCILVCAIFAVYLYVPYEESIKEKNIIVKKA